MDEPHDHPAHYMYCVNGGTLKLMPPPAPISYLLSSFTLTMKTGEAPIIPAGPHRVANMGKTEPKIVFLEPFKNIPPVQELPGFVSPFAVYKQGYKKLGEDKDWIIGKMTMKAGASDPPHSHYDHIVYVLSGSTIAIMPIPDMSKPGAFAEKMEVPLTPGMSIPVPAVHNYIKCGEGDCELIFFERKGPGSDSAS
jgi:hypothetical protein